ncbi:GHKL domain-containing protein [uncultured Vagococcus sp.]|uniref:sensor histidine kinase n=1 Tax=uncultured Vagococcus sp. TaxID=189676 RepID=UPI0028D45CD7|nr:GHKL domain-containing protein [uncultured Vagococcus sp.]
MVWLMYINTLHVAIIYVILEQKMRKTSYLLLLLLVLFCGAIDFYSFLGALLLTLIGLTLISHFNNAKYEMAIYISSLSLFLSMIFDKIAAEIVQLLQWESNYIFFILVSLLITIPFSFLAKKISRKYIYKKTTKYIFTVIYIILWGMYYLNQAHSFYFPTNVTLSLVISVIFIIIILIFIAILLIYTKLMSEKEIKREESQEAAHLQTYIFEMEKYNTEVRKFRHDYQNILTSLEIFIMEDDMVGLKEYFQLSIKRESILLNNQIQKISDLNKIEVIAIKSILANKLIYAQEKGIDVTFEAVEKVSEINLETVGLVRIIGIIMDNAIEATEIQGNGIIRVAIFYINQDLFFIFENTCEKEVVSIHELTKNGVSTKGNGRGQGLTNLAELVAKYDNLFLETRIENLTFIQQIIIS